MRDAREMILAALEHGYEHGFVTAELIKKYAPEGPYSVFLCGPQQMYRFVDKELEKLGLERKYIRHELFGEFHDPKQKADYPSGAPDTVRIAVTVRGGRPGPSPAPPTTPSSKPWSAAASPCPPGAAAASAAGATPA